MTDTLSTDEAALLRAICAVPDEDTPRLAYADWLDEQDQLPDRACPKCKGRKWTPIEMTKKKVTCNTCFNVATQRASGTVHDTSRADRAELIRVQVELAARAGTDQEREECSWGGTCNCRSHQLWRRESALLAAHPEWSQCPCPACEGDGKERLGAGVRTQRDCPTCSGSGDLLHDFRPVLRRGFLWELTVPTMGVVGARSTEECPRCGGSGDGGPSLHCSHCGGDGLAMGDWQPPPWLMAVVAAVPTLEKIVVADRDVGGVACSWLKDDESREPYSIPSPIFEAMYRLHRHNQRDGRWLYFDTPAAAVDALARGVVAFGRGKT